MIVGGANPRLTAVEATTDGVDFESDIPDLPVANHHHCVVAVDDDTLISIGGSAGDGRSVYRYVTGDEEWEELEAKTPRPHVAAGCGLVVVDEGPNLVLVAGHADYPTYSNATDVLDLNSMEWTEGMYGLVGPKEVQIIC